MKTNKYQQAMDQVNLSTEADERISAAIEAARQEQKVIPLPGGRAKKSAFRFGRAAVIAAVLAGLLIATSLGSDKISRIAFRTEPVTKDQMIFGNEEGWVEIYFEQTTDEALELGVWEPGSVPKGYEKIGTFDNDKVGYHRDNWGTDAGEIFYFSYQLPRPAGSESTSHVYVVPEWTLEEGNVTINGSPGQYFITHGTNDRAWANLYWTDPEAGIGFTIITCDLSLGEVITIAESVRPQ